MSVLVQVNGAWMDSRVPDLIRRLQAHDPRLELDARMNDARQVVRYEVYWLDQQGKRRFVSMWRPDEVGRIEADIMALDRSASGHVPSIDKIDRHNAAMEKAADEEAQGWYREAIEHGARLFRDRTEGRHFFPVRGR